MAVEATDEAAETAATDLRNDRRVSGKGSCMASSGASGTIAVAD
jgi:hypothetical protein